ncbi:MAG: hypothetical protein F8N39_01190, partial [Clostridiaceae bacterium]|nr:hypothetical protein [Clostridiaceae bacterium]
YYFISPYDVLVQNTESNKQVFYDIFTKQKINADKSTIKSDYKQIKQNSKDNNSINLLNKIKSSSLNSPNLMNMNEESLSQSLSEIMEKADVPNCDAATFYTTNQFSGENNCGPTAGTTLVMYWNVQRGISSSSAPSLVFNQLYADMKTNAGHSGTYADDCYNGLLRYANEAGRPPLGSDFINTWGTGTMVSYETIRGNIVNGNPVLVATYAPHTKYGNHFVDIFGIEHNTSDYYLRIADGWTSSHQTWISYSELYPEVMLYLRW